MRAAIVTRAAEGKVLAVAEVPTPQIGADEVLVRVGRAGICGSDTNGFQDSHGTSRDTNLIMGHEIGGVVAAVGNRVAGVEVGTGVHADPQVVCGRCEPCRSGWISICDRKMVLGSSLRGFVQGAMAEFVTAQATAVYPLPDSVSDEQAPLLEPLVNAIHVLQRLQANGGTVLVLGAGPLGLAMVEAMEYGVATIIVSDTSEAKREIALSAGASAAIDPLVEDVPARVRELVGQVGVDITIEAVGIESTYQQATQSTRKRGSVGFFGAVAPRSPYRSCQSCTRNSTSSAAPGPTAPTSTRPSPWWPTAGSVPRVADPDRGAGGRRRGDPRALTDPKSRTVKLLVDPTR